MTIALIFGCDNEPAIGPTSPNFVTFSGSSSVTAFETEGILTFTVITSSAKGVDATITASSSNATAGVDYNLNTTSVSIGENEYEATVSFEVINNFEEDGNKTVTITLSSEDLPLGGASSITVTIVDDDCAYDRTLIDGVLVGTDSRPFAGQQYASAADFTYVSETLIQAVDINTPWMEGFWLEDVVTAHTVDIVVDPTTLALTVDLQPLSYTFYSGDGQNYNYTIDGSGSIDTCGEKLTLVYNVKYDDGSVVRNGYTLEVALPQPSL